MSDQSGVYGMQRIPVLDSFSKNMKLSTTQSFNLSNAQSFHRTQQYINLRRNGGFSQPRVNSETHTEIESTYKFVIGLLFAYQQNSPGSAYIVKESIANFIMNKGFALAMKGANIHESAALIIKQCMDRALNGPFSVDNDIYDYAERLRISPKEAEELLRKVEQDKRLSRAQRILENHRKQHGEGTFRVREVD